MFRIDIIFGKRAVIETNTDIFKGKIINQDEDFIYLKLGRNREIKLINKKIINVITISFRSSTNAEFLAIDKSPKEIEYIDFKISDIDSLKLPKEGADIFDDKTLTDLEKKLMQRKFMYINNVLYLDRVEANETLNLINFKGKVNGREIESNSDLTEYELSFLEGGL